MTNHGSERLGKLCTVGGAGALLLAMLAWVLTVSLGWPLGVVTVVTVPLGVGLLVVGTASIGAVPIVKALLVLLFVGALVGASFLVPVVRALNLEPVVFLFALLVVIFATFALGNSQTGRWGHNLSIDYSKGYDGRSGDREWIPEDDGNDK